MPVLSDSRKPPMKSKERQPIRIHKPLQAATSYDNMTKAVLPHDNFRVNNILAGQFVRTRNFRLTRSATAKFSAFIKQFIPRRTVNRTINTASAKQRTVRRINNCVTFHLSYIIPNNLQRQNNHPLNSQF